MSGLEIRAFRTSDRGAVETICRENGLSGRLDELFCDGELFAKLWLSPFLDGERETCWVAERDGVVVGYLVSSMREGFQGRALRCLLPWLGRLVWRWGTGRYREHPASGRFVRWILGRSWRETPSSPPGAANFHFSVSGQERSLGVAGPALLAAYSDELRRRGVREQFIHVFLSDSTRGYGFYRRLGLRTYDLRACSLFGGRAALACFVGEVPSAGVYAGRRKGLGVSVSVVLYEPGGWVRVRETMESIRVQWHEVAEVIVVCDVEPTGEVAEVLDSAGVRVVTGRFSGFFSAGEAGVLRAVGDVVVVSTMGVALEPKVTGLAVSRFERGEGRVWWWLARGRLVARAQD